MSVRMGIRLRARVAAAAVMILLLPAFMTPASASDRVALVIGNANYDHVPVLANPLNDASDIGAALDRLGFEVTRLENADQIALRRGLREFKLAASVSEMAVVFYAGHGIEVDNRNFLVPVDARLRSDDDVEFETVPLDLLSRAVDGAKDLGLIILDACRDNPFAVAMHRAGRRRARSGAAWRGWNPQARHWWPMRQRRGRSRRTGRVVTAPTRRRFSFTLRSRASRSA